MKKLILPLLLLVALTMLVAVESAPSSVVGYVKYDCVAGLNVICIPMQESYAWASEIAEAYPGMFDAFNYWDAASQAWLGASDLGGFWDGDFAITNGMALWANAVSVGTFYSIGALPTTQPTYPLVSGLNMIMLPLNKSNLTFASEIGADIGTLDSVNYWNATSQAWLGASDLGGFWDGDFPTTIGSGYWVNSLSPTTWPSRAAAKTSRNK